MTTFRTSLPHPMPKTQDVGVWSFLKGCIGKELSKVTMPIEFNEPLSFLQRLCEYMEYSHLLDTADHQQDSATRIEYVTAFAVSALAANADRIYKPFNPLLGETYELVREDLDFKFVAEQVSHHPPISAFHAESEHFEFCGAVHPRVKFWGKSLEVKPEGRFTVTLKSRGDKYTWRNVNCFVHNILVGKLWFEQIGVMELVGETTGQKVVLNFRSSGQSTRDRHCVDGFLYDSSGEKSRFLHGKWTEALRTLTMQEYIRIAGSPSHKHKMSKLSSFTRSLTGGGPSSDHKDLEVQDGANNHHHHHHHPPGLGTAGKLLWEVTPKPDNSHLYYEFTQFTMSLNQFAENQHDLLPPTDSRFRPDLRLYEEGEKEKARLDKERLEQKQRENRKRDKENWTPLWFVEDADKEWKFTRSYWDRKFSHCPHLY